MQPCCLGLIILLSIPLLAWIILLYRKGFFSTFLGRFVIWGVVLLLLTIAYHPILKHLVGYTKLESAAQFGDQYGALNSFISGLAFIGLVLTLLMQREDLNLQRKEMHDTREEFKKQTEQFKIQTNLQHRQLEDAKLISQQQLELQAKTAWMQETMMLISRLTEQINSLKCHFGDTTETYQSFFGAEVIVLLHKASTETIAYNFSVKSFQRLDPNIQPFLPTNIKDRFFKNLDGVHDAIRNVHSVMHLHFNIIERIWSTPYMNDTEKGKLCMAVPLFASQEYNLLRYLFENKCKRLWIPFACSACEKYAEHKKKRDLEDDALLKSLVHEFISNVQIFILQAIHRIMKDIMTDANKNFDENFAFSSNKEAKDAYEIFSYLNNTILSKEGNELCQQSAREYLTALTTNNS